MIDAPVPRRGRPQREPRPPTATPLTKGGFDVDGLAWSPDGGQLAVTGQQAPDDLTTWQVAIVDVATGESSIVAGTHSHDTGVRWGPDGSLFYLSDEDGWFQVIRRRPTAATASPSRTASASTASLRHLRLRAAAVARRTTCRASGGS